MKNLRFFLITSPIQLLYCFLLKKNFNDNFKNFVIIFNPFTNNFSYKSIIFTANKLGIKNFIDIRSDFKSLLSKKKIGNHLSKINKEHIYKKRLIKRKIISIIKKKIPSSNTMEFYIRNLYSLQFEQVFIDAFNKQKFFGFIDGIGDFLQLKDKIYNNPKLNFFSAIIFKRFVEFIQSLVIGNFKEKMYLPNNFVKQKTPNEHDLIKLKKLIKLVSKQQNNKNIELIIYGLPTIEYKKRFNLNIKKEINIYNDVIIQLNKNYKIKSKNIWFKCHPRLTFRNYKVLKKNIKCKFFSFHDNEIGESKLLNKYLKYVLSPGSTTLFYAHKIFKKKCIFLNLNNQNIEKKSFGKQQIRFFEKLNFTTIEPNKIYKT